MLCKGSENSARSCVLYCSTSSFVASTMRSSPTPSRIRLSAASILCPFVHDVQRTMLRLVEALLYLAQTRVITYNPSLCCGTPRTNAQY